VQPENVVVGKQGRLVIGATVDDREIAPSEVCNLYHIDSLIPGYFLKVCNHFLVPRRHQILNQPSVFPIQLLLIPLQLLMAVLKSSNDGKYKLAVNTPGSSGLTLRPEVKRKTSFLLSYVPHFMGREGSPRWFINCLNFDTTDSLSDFRQLFGHLDRFHQVKGHPWVEIGDILYSPRYPVVLSECIRLENVLGDLQSDIHLCPFDLNHYPPDCTVSETSELNGDRR
jgi:hypothetical protein